MSREVRRVAKDWQHPRNLGTYSNGAPRYEPLHEGYAEAAADFLQRASTEGLQGALDYYGSAPNKDEYMPEWPEAEKTHLMMYETCSEGTPISPAFATAEELARWLADNKASAFGDMTATYEQWLAMCRVGHSVGSGVAIGGVMMSGVAAVSEIP